METTLGQLAAALGIRFVGYPGQRLTGIATLQNAAETEVAFLANPRYKKLLATTAAGAVILAPGDVKLCPRPCLISDNPYLTYAQAAAYLYPSPPSPGEVHPSAVISADAHIGRGVSVGPNAVIEAGVRIDDGAVIGPGCVVRAGATLGAGTTLTANATIGGSVTIGRDCLLQSGVVIGADGFGFAKDGARWVKVPQLGAVWIGDDVEIGANTTVDRGAIEDTVIERGVKLDNQIQVAHGVRIGEHTAIAACVGISGSTVIGKRCVIAGGVGFVGHLEICDDVRITGMSMVTRSIRVPGVYSGIPAEPNAIWRRNIARFKRLDELLRRLESGGVDTKGN